MGWLSALPAGEAARLKTEVLRTDPLIVPLKKGEPLGTLRVTTASGTVVTEVPLFVLETVEEAGPVGPRGTRCASGSSNHLPCNHLA